MLASLTYINRQTPSVVIPVGSLLVIGFLSYQIGELACNNLLMCFEARNFSDMEHALFRFNPLRHPHPSTSYHWLQSVRTCDIISNDSFYCQFSNIITKFCILGQSGMAYSYPGGLYNCYSCCDSPKVLCAKNSSENQATGIIANATEIELYV